VYIDALKTLKLPSDKVEKNFIRRYPIIMRKDIAPLYDMKKADIAAD